MRSGWRGRGLPRGARALRSFRIYARRGPSLPNPLAAPDEVRSRPDVRLWVVGAVFLVLFSFVGARLAVLQLADHAQALASVVNDSVRLVSVPAPRGDVVARDGTVLVANTLDQEVVVSKVDAAAPGLVPRLAALIGKTPGEVRASLSSVQYTTYQPVPVLTHAPASVVAYLEEHAAEFPGVSVETLTERAYPGGGALAPQLLGYVGQISPSQYAVLKNKGWPENSTIGQDGIEAYYDSYLRGVNGSQRIVVDAFGNPLSVESTVSPVPGDTVVLNIDPGLQSFVDQALSQDITRVRNTKDPVSGLYPKAINGAVVVLDPRNGQVLAMASYPSYDLSVWQGGISTANYRALTANPDASPLDDYAIDGLYTPGSTFKLVTATAALDDHLIGAGDYVDDTGTFKVPGCLQGAAGCVFHDDDNTALGEVDLPMALTESSDYYFYNLGYQFWASYVNDPGYRYGATPIQNIAADYGLSEPTGIDLPGEATSIVDSPSVVAAEHRQYPGLYPNGSWYTGNNIEMAFGQGGTVLTPIGLADAYATFANGGTRYAPQVAAAILSPKGKVLEDYAPHVEGHVALPASTYDPILQGLLGVVNDPTGTAYQAFHTYATFNLASFPVAGKTGTASNAGLLEPNSWFVGFGPVPDARYVVLCVIGQGGYGADAAAPVVAQTFSYLVAHPVTPVVLHPARGAPR